MVYKIKESRARTCCKWMVTSSAIVTQIGLILSLTFTSPLGIISVSPVGANEMILAGFELMCSVVLTGVVVYGNHWRIPDLLMTYLWISILMAFPAFCVQYYRPQNLLFIQTLGWQNATMFLVMGRCCSIMEPPVNRMITVPLTVLLYMILIVLLVFMFVI